MTEIEISDAAPPARRKCVVCAEVIPEGASKCTKCGSYQNWTRYILTVANVAAVIVAVAPLWAIAISLGRLALPDGADLSFQLQACAGDGITVTVANLGDTVGMVSGVQFDVSRTPQRLDTTMDQRTLVPVQVVPPLKPNDVITIQYRSSTVGTLPRKDNAKTCLYGLRFNGYELKPSLFGKATAVAVSKERQTCPCPE